MDEWTNEEFFNPFGPNILRLKINEDIRLKILDSIYLCINNHEQMVFEELDSLNNAVKNSIVDGKMGKVSAAQLTGPENIIKNTIQRVLCRYGEHFYNIPCISSITDVWYVVMKAGDFHMLHSHLGSAELSGAIYLEVPDNLPDPQGNINWILGGTGGHGKWNLSEGAWGCSPKLGEVFLWPSWLMHMVYPFRSKQERIMISFNGQAVQDTRPTEHK